MYTSVNLESLPAIIYLDLRIYKKQTEKVQYKFENILSKLKKYDPVISWNYPIIYVLCDEEVKEKGYLVTYEDGNCYLSIVKVTFEIACENEVVAKSKIEEILRTLPDTFSQIEIRKRIFTEVQAI